MTGAGQGFIIEINQGEMRALRKLVAGQKSLDFDGRAAAHVENPDIAILNRHP